MNFWIKFCTFVDEPQITLIFCNAYKEDHIFSDYVSGFRYDFQKCIDRYKGDWHANFAGLNNIYISRSSMALRSKMISIPYSK